jgi:hypothetical protein
LNQAPSAGNVRPSATGGRSLAALVAILLLLPAAAEATWNQPVGGPSPINEAEGRNAFKPSVTAIGGVPYVAWSEIDDTNFEVRVARVNGTGTDWEEPWTGVSATSGGINESTNRDGGQPSLTAIGGVPYVAWEETDGTNSELRVARLNGTGGWEEPWTGVSATSGGINESTNRDGGQPSLTAIGDVPYVAWSEDDGANNEIRVARLNAAGTAWEEPWTGVSATSGEINEDTDLNGAQPSLTPVGGVPYVAWSEDDGANNEIRVARLNAAGTAWEQPVGGASPINQANDQLAVNPSLTAIGGVPYVAWREDDGTNFEIRVTRLNVGGTAWEQVVGGPSPINQADGESAERPSLTAIGGVPYVTWSEDDGPTNELRAARLNAAGTAWEGPWTGASATSGGINQANDLDARDPSLTPIGGVPYVGWSENDGTNFELRVARLEPEFTTQAATPSSAGATFVTDVRTYGIPYPVGFRFGSALESETPTETTPAGTENVTVTRQVGGLSPSTGYQFRPFATAGLAQPRVFGTTGTFTTLPAPPGPAPSPGPVSGPSPSPGLPPNPADTQGPGLKLSGKREQELSKQVTVTAVCIDEPCELAATGELGLPAEKSKRSPKAIKLRSASADVGADEPRKLGLKLNKASFKVANRALAAGNKATAKITVTASDAAGNKTVETWKVKVVA